VGVYQILCAVTFALSVALVALNGFRGQWWIYVFRFLILFSSIIPIRCAEHIFVRPVPLGQANREEQSSSQSRYGKDSLRTANYD
jgi:hypothetical protein